LSELGVTFVHWRRQVRLAAALPRLAAGEAVARIAVDLGYQTPSAFSAMFRRLTGSTPSRYFALSDSA
ncbi:helix-turn-helix domain-containing protein, partial [Pseudomonas aeruginosa]